MTSSPAVPYVDTSALAKWYLNEDASDEVEAYLRSFPFARISSLTVVEMRCLLARRRRYQELTSRQEAQCFALFQTDVTAGHLKLTPLQDEHTRAAAHLMEILPDHPLRTLDALHLALVRSEGFEALATADRTMAAAAADLGLTVQRFSL